MTVRGWWCLSCFWCTDDAEEAAAHVAQRPWVSLGTDYEETQRPSHFCLRPNLLRVTLRKEGKIGAETYTKWGAPECTCHGSHVPNADRCPASATDVARCPRCLRPHAVGQPCPCALHEQRSPDCEYCWSSATDPGHSPGHPETTTED